MKDTFYRRETKRLAIIDKPFSYEMKILSNGANLNKITGNVQFISQNARNLTGSPVQSGRSFVLLVFDDTTGDSTQVLFSAVGSFIRYGWTSYGTQPYNKWTQIN